MYCSSLLQCVVLHLLNQEFVIIWLRNLHKLLVTRRNAAELSNMIEQLNRLSFVCIICERRVERLNNYINSCLRRSRYLADFTQTDVGADTKTKSLHGWYWHSMKSLHLKACSFTLFNPRRPIGSARTLLHCNEEDSLKKNWCRICVFRAGLIHFENFKHGQACGMSPFQHDQTTPIPLIASSIYTGVLAWATLHIAVFWGH